MNDTRRRSEGEYAILDQQAHDPSPAKADHLAAIRSAIIKAADLNGGEVTAATVRPHLPEWVDDHRIGAVFSDLLRSGALIDTGRMARSDDARNRNRNRKKPIYALSALAVA